ncbi:MAG: hypothetical protein IJL08_00070, partial [Oscillospiraceae bacterium]|nr:hypothetical protein [Oscillospiraceae bacterium]
MKKKILSVLLAVVMLVSLLPAGIAEAANTLPDTVTAIAVNATVSGSMEESEYGYRFDLSSNGYISINYNHPTVSGGSWTMELWNSALSTVYTVSAAGSDAALTTGKIGLPSGRYYLIFRGTSSSDGLPFSFRVNYTASGEWETELNNTQSAADLISADSSVRGSLMTTSDVDCYYFEVYSEVAVRLSMKHGFTGTSDSVWKVTVSPTNGSAARVFYFHGNTEDTENGGILCFTGGGCYVTVEKGSVYSNSDYQLILDVLPGRWESEPNNDQGSATLISLGETVYGSGTDGTYDYFALDAADHGVRFLLSGVSEAILIGGGSSVQIGDGTIYGLGSGNWFLRVRGGDEYNITLVSVGNYELEPNDDLSSANELPIGAVVPGNTYDGSVDWYRIGTTAQVLRFHGVQGFLVDPTGTQIPVNDGTVIGLREGYHYLCVQGPTDYELSVDVVGGNGEEEGNNSASASTLIPMGDSRGGQINYAGDEDWYRFNLANRSQVIIAGYMFGIIIDFGHEVVEGGTGSWTVELRGSTINGTISKTFPINESGGGMYGGLGLPEGEYYLRVTGSGVTGKSYNLSVIRDDSLWQSLLDLDNSLIELINSPDLPVNETVHGHLISSGDDSTSSFTPDADGVLTLNFTHEDLGADEASHYYWKVALYDEEYTLLKAVSYTGGGTGGDWPAIGIRGGHRYYIVVTTDNSTYFSSSNFTLTPHFTADNTWEAEQNGDYDAAREMDVDTDVHGTYMHAGDKDYYHFFMPLDGGIFPWFSHDVKEGSAAKWTVELRNENHDLLRTWTYVAGEESFLTQEGVGLAAGDYYLIVTGDNASVQAGLKYTIQAHLDPCPWENELNNTMDLPSPLALNTTTKGSLSTASDVDWYYIDTDESGVLRLDFTHPDLGVDATYAYWRVTLYDNGGTNALKAWAWSGVGTGSTWGPIGLQAGTWLVKVECPTASSSGTTYYDGGTYTLTANWEASDEWEDEINAGYDNARELTAETAVHGAFMFSGDYDYYVFTLDEGKGIFPYFSHEVKEGSTASWTVELRNSDHTTMRSWSYTAGEESYETEEGVGLPAGTYYLVVSGTDYASQSLLPYALTLHLDDAKWEEEYNDTRATANELEPDRVGDVTLRGSLMTSSDVDYYKLVADKAGYFRLAFSHPDLGVDATNNLWTVSVLDSSGDTLVSHTYWGKGTAGTFWDEIGVAKGTWYIKVERYSTSSSIYYSPATYTLDLEWVTGIPFEQEWNNSFDTATEMQVGSLMPGSLMTSGDVDYFRFTLSEDSGLYLQMFYEQAADSNASWKLTLYDDQHTEILSRTFNRKDEADFIRDDGIGLPAGEYFVKVSSGTWTSKPYELQFDRSEALWERENNSTMARANELEPDRVGDVSIIGSLVTGSDVDYYKLVADKPGYFRLAFTHPDRGVDATNGLWTVSVLDSSGNTLESKSYTGKGTGGTFWDEIGVAKGTWYIKVERYSTSSNTYYDNGVYTLDLEWVTGIPFEQEWNNSFDTATEIQVGSLMPGSLMTSGDVDYFHFTLDESSGLYLQMFYVQAESSNASWKLTLYDDQHTEILNRTFNQKDEADLIRDDGIGLPAGEYYVTVSNGGTWTSKPYELQLDASSAAWEQENNNSMGKANTLPHDTDLYGSLATGSDVDYYKLNLLMGSGVTLTFHHPDLGVDSTNNLWTVSLLDASGTTVDSANYWGKGTGATWTTAGLASGTWYVKVERYSTSSSTYYSPAIYTLKADVDILTYREKESNDNKETANSLAVNRTITGNRMTSGDSDWYRLDLEENGFLTLCVGHDTVDTSNACWTFTLYDDSEQTMTTLSPKGNSPSGLTTQSIGLTAGTYYVAVTSANTWSDALYTLEAQFSTEGLWETEYNNTFGTADTLPLSQTIHGNLMTGTDADYYTFDITQPGYVELCFAHASTGDSNTKWTLTLYDAECTSVINYNFAGNGSAYRSGGLGLPQGKYYAAVTRYSTNGSSYYSDYVYDLTADFHAAYDWEEESNDTKPTANLIQTNVPVHGSRMTSSDTDYFFFE